MLRFNYTLIKVDYMLRINIYGSAAVGEKPELAPTAEDIQRAVVVAQDHGITLTIYLIDRRYNHVWNAGAKGASVDRIRALTKITRPDSAIAVVTVVPTFILDPKLEAKDGDVIQVLHWGNPSSSLPGFLLEGTTMKSSYDCMSLLRSYHFGHWYYSSGWEACNPHQLMIDYLAQREGKEGKLLPPRPHNPFDGGAIFAISAREWQGLQGWLILMTRLATTYLQFQFLQLEEAKGAPQHAEIPSWTLNVETAPLYALITHYGLFSTEVDLTPGMLLITSRRYRYQVAAVLLRVLSNLSINNGWLDKEAVIKAGGWQSAATYRILQERITGVKVATVTTARMGE
jgi:hypothetical protein